MSLESAYLSDPRVISTTTGLSFIDSRDEVWYVKLFNTKSWMLVNADGTKTLVNYASADDALAVFLGPPRTAGQDEPGQAVA